MPTYESYHGRKNISYGIGKVTCRRFYIIRGADPLFFQWGRIMVVTRRQWQWGYLANVLERWTTTFYGQPPLGTTPEADDEVEREEMEVEEVEVLEEVVVDRQPRLQLLLPQQLQL